MDGLSAKLPRTYVNECLVPVLVKEKKKYRDTFLYKALYDAGLKDLQKRTANKPEPLPNWTRQVPEVNSRHSKKGWDILRPFLESPSHNVFDFTRNQKRTGLVVKYYP